MIQLAQRLQNIAVSATLALSQQAQELQQQGKPVINLTVGEPDFDTPQYIKDSAIAAINNGFTKYTAVDGTKQLKQAIINKLATDNHLHYQPEQIIVSCGAKHSLFNAFAAILNQDDEVIIPAPYWVSYPDMVKIFGARPVIIDSNITHGLKLTPEQLAASITPKTRALILNSPNNPTGMCYSRQELAAFADILQQYPQVIVISDDIYEHIIWPPATFANIVNSCPAMYDRTIVINGVSKAYAMTGWRIGFAAGPAQIIKAMKIVQSQSTSNPNSIAQVAACTAFSGEQTSVSAMAATFNVRYNLIFTALQSMPGVKCLASHGAFYVFPDITALLTIKPDISNDIQLSSYLLNEAYVAVMPGTPFGAPGHLRISFAASTIDLETAMQRLHAKLSELSN
jgi:aspartate aminotransferase